MASSPTIAPVDLKDILRELPTPFGLSGSSRVPPPASTRPSPPNTLPAPARLQTWPGPDPAPDDPDEHRIATPDDLGVARTTWTRATAAGCVLNVVTIAAVALIAWSALALAARGRRNPPTPRSRAPSSIS